MKVFFWCGGGGRVRIRPSLSHVKKIVTYELKPDIYFYLFRPNTHANVEKFTKNKELKLLLVFWDLQTQFICHEAFCVT